MNLLTSLANAIAVGFACLCVSTVAAQAALGVVLWSNGALTPTKLLRYTAVVYGVDLTELPSEQGPQEAPVPPQPVTRQEIIESRAQNPLLQDRQKAIEEGIGAVNDLFVGVREESSRFDERKKIFDAHLKTKEDDARRAAIEEVRLTLTSLRPKQAKNLIVRMLKDRDLDPDDDVMGDVVTMLLAMPDDKTKKIFGEFQDEQESALLHMIFRAISELEST